MTLLYKYYKVKDRERNLWVNWVNHSGFGRPRFYKRKIAEGYPWECYAYGFSWGKLDAYIAANTYTATEIQNRMNKDKKD